MRGAGESSKCFNRVISECVKLADPADGSPPLDPSSLFQYCKRPSSKSCVSAPSSFQISPDSLSPCNLHLSLRSLQNSLGCSVRNAGTMVTIAPGEDRYVTFRAEVPPLEVPETEPELVPKESSGPGSPCPGCPLDTSDCSACRLDASTCSSSSASPPASPLVYRGALSRTSLGNCSSPSLLSAMAGASGGTAAAPPPAPAAKLPRTLSTSVLRIKHRSSFWDKFWDDRTKRHK